MVCGYQFSEKLATSISRVEVDFTFADGSNMFFRNLRNHLPGHIVMVYDPADRGLDALKFVQNLAQYPHTRTHLRVTPQLTVTSLTST